MTGNFSVDERTTSVSTLGLGTLEPSDVTGPTTFTTSESDPNGKFVTEFNAVAKYVDMRLRLVLRPPVVTVIVPMGVLGWFTLGEKRMLVFGAIDASSG